MPRPDWMPDFVPVGAKLVFDPTSGNVHLQWPADDGGLWEYRPGGALLERILDDYPGWREMREELGVAV